MQHRRKRRKAATDMTKQIPKTKDGLGTSSNSSAQESCQETLKKKGVSNYAKSIAEKRLSLVFNPAKREGRGNTRFLHQLQKMKRLGEEERNQALIARCLTSYKKGVANTRLKTQRRASLGVRREDKRTLTEH